MTRRQYFAEGIGTFALVFAGCGGIIVNDLYAGVLGHVGVSLVFGLIVMVMIYSVGNISGAHINPAVTLGFLFAGRLARRGAYFLSEQSTAGSGCCRTRAAFSVSRTPDPWRDVAQRISSSCLFH